MGEQAATLFNDFLEIIGTQTGLNGLGSPQFEVPQALPNEFFVPPVLLPNVEESDPSIILVSARGAAGKSTVARQLALRLRSPLWKLEMDKAVSGTSLEHALMQFLGTHQIKPVLRSASQPIVVIDSLDEARVRVSGTSWQEFVSSIEEFTADGIQCILFGRERTLEDLWVNLTDAGVTVSWWEISHFAPDRCREYVDEVVRHRDPETDRTSEKYTRARDALIDALRRAATGSHSEAFVGYPPVLDAVSAMLIKKPNYLAIRQSFETINQTSPDRIALLKKIMEGLLEREQTKVAPVASELGLPPASSYLPPEQIQWLCHSLEKSPYPDMSHIDDEKIRNEYSERVSSFAEEHAFRSEGQWASPVFEAYVAATEFNGNLFTSSRLLDIGQASGLLFDFVDAKDELIIEEAQFAALHASLIASEWTKSSIDVAISTPPEEEYFEGYVAIKRGDSGDRRVDFKLIPETPDTLRLMGPLTHLTIDSRGRVELTSRGASLPLGPDLFIRGRDIRAEGTNVEITRKHRSAGSDDSGEPNVVMEASQELILPTECTQLPPYGELELRVPKSLTLHYPWVSHRVDLDEDEGQDQKVVRLINKLMNLTRNHGHRGERGVFIMKFAGRQPFNTTDFHRALTVLTNEGVVRIDEDIVFLRAEWEKYRYSGKRIPGQQQLEDVQYAWAPIIKAIQEELNR